LKNKNEQKVEEGNRKRATGRRTEGGRMNGCRLGINVAEPKQTYIQSNVEPEAKSVVVVAWRGGEVRRQKGWLGGRTVGRDLLRAGRKQESEGKVLDVQKREGSGGSKSERQ
jgi:hypothetical protein